MACLFHKWNGCKCSKCGKVRDEGHNWDFCHGTCVICGKVCTTKHSWQDVPGKYVKICNKCGIRQAKRHDWNGNYKDISNDFHDLKEVFSPEDLGIGSVFQIYIIDPPRWNGNGWCRVIEIDYNKEFVSYTPCSYRSPHGSTFAYMFYGYDKSNSRNRCYIPK